MSKLGTLKSQRALAVRYHGADSAQARAAKSRLDAEKTAVYVKRLLAKAPELTDKQRNDLAELLRPVRVTGRGAPVTDKQTPVSDEQIEAS